MNDNKENHNSISTSQFLNKMIFFRACSLSILLFGRR